MGYYLLHSALHRIPYYNIPRARVYPYTGYGNFWPTHCSNAKVNSLYLCGRLGAAGLLVVMAVVLLWLSQRSYGRYVHLSAGGLLAHLHLPSAVCA